MRWHLGVAIALAVSGQAQPSAPLTLELRVFNGNEDVSSQTRVTVHRAGERATSLAQLPAGTSRLTVSVPPGIYDVQAIREREGRVVNIRWAERLVVMPYPDEAGQHLEVINFRNGFGALQVRGRDATTTPAVAIYAAGDRTHEVAAPAAGTGYVLFVVPAGSYDLQVRGGLEARWHGGIEIPLDRTRLWVVPELPRQGAFIPGSDPSAADELDDDHNQCDDEEQVNQAARDLHHEAQHPQHQQNRDDRPEHLSPSPAARAAGLLAARRIPQHDRFRRRPRWL